MSLAGEQFFDNAALFCPGFNSVRGIVLAHIFILRGNRFRTGNNFLPNDIVFGARGNAAGEGEDDGQGREVLYV